MDIAVSVDIGGTNTRVAMINNHYEIIDQISFATDADNYDNTMKRIINEVNIHLEDNNILGIGVSCPGPLDLINGTILNPPNLKGWHNFKLVDYLEKKTKLPCFLENDANLAGLAEATIGAGKGHEYVQYLTISTGLGGGFIQNGEIYLGARGYAQEIANVIVKPEGYNLPNLAQGSLESICSGTGIVSQARELGLRVTHAGDVNDLASNGNKECKEIINNAKLYLGNTIAAIYAFLDPDIVVLGGGVANNIEGFVEDVALHAKNKMYGDFSKHVKVANAALGDDNGILGGAILVFNKTK